MWGGNAAHTHEWGALLRVDKQHVWKPGAAGLQERQRESGAHERVNGRFCECGAWLGSLGLEPDPELYIEHLVGVFRHVKRVLRDDATLWVNLGDSYAGSGKGPSNSLQAQASQLNRGKGQLNGAPQQWLQVPEGAKPKDLLMMPFRVAMALQQDGWYLRSVIPWLKRNAMPESVTDRPATSVEYVFLLAKSRRYFWEADAVRQKAEYGRRDWTDVDGNMSAVTGARAIGATPTARGTATVSGKHPETGRSFRNSDLFFQTWQGLLTDEQSGEPLAFVVNPAPFTGAHFATFPPKLVEPMILAGTSEKGCCPECGAPWVRVTEKDKYEPPVVAIGERNVDASRGDKVRKLDGKSDAWRESAASARTVGWRASCAHAEAAPVPCTVLDPFAGAATTLLVADRLGRNAIGCELNDAYATMATERVVGDAPLFTEVSA